MVSAKINYHVESLLHRFARILHASIRSVDTISIWAAKKSYTSSVDQEFANVEASTHSGLHGSFQKR